MCLFIIISHSFFLLSLALCSVSICISGFSLGSLVGRPLCVAWMTLCTLCVLFFVVIALLWLLLLLMFCTSYILLLSLLAAAADGVVPATCGGCVEAMMLLHQFIFPHNFLFSWQQQRQTHKHTVQACTKMTKSQQQQQQRKHNTLTLKITTTTPTKVTRV